VDLPNLEQVRAAFEGRFRAPETAIQTLMVLCHANAVHHGFWDDSPNFGEKIALIHSELSEALEADRANDAPDSHLPELPGRAVELADALVRIFDTAAGFNIPLAEAFVAKMKYNIDRPVKHGKKY